MNIAKQKDELYITYLFWHSRSTRSGEVYGFSYLKLSDNYSNLQQAFKDIHSSRILQAASTGNPKLSNPKLQHPSYPFAAETPLIATQTETKGQRFWDSSGVLLASSTGAPHC